MSFQSPTVQLFRLFNAASTPLSPTDSLKFNASDVSGYKSSTDVGGYITQIKKTIPEGIGNNQSAEVPDGNLQPLGVVETTYQITGFITNINAVNSFLDKLVEWKESSNAINGIWSAGRFGISDAGDRTNTLLPVSDNESSPQGLFFTNYEKTNDVARNRADFVLTFRKSRGFNIEFTSGP